MIYQRNITRTCVFPKYNILLSVRARNRLFDSLCQTKHINKPPLQYNVQT